MSAPAFVKQIETTLADDLRQFDIKARVLWEQVLRTRLFRFYVVSDDFEHMQHSERQEVVWRILRAHFSESQLAYISMVLTATSEEISTDELPKSATARKRGSKRF